MRESKIERDFCKYVKSKGCKIRKYVSPGVKGVSDRLVFLPGGRLILMEVKAPGKGLSVFQERETKKMRYLGHRCYWCDNFEEARKIFDQELSRALVLGQS